MKHIFSLTTQITVESRHDERSWSYGRRDTCYSGCSDEDTKQVNMEVFCLFRTVWEIFLSEPVGV